MFPENMDCRLTKENFCRLARSEKLGDVGRAGSSFISCKAGVDAEALREYENDRTPPECDGEMLRSIESDALGTTDSELPTPKRLVNGCDTRFFRRGKLDWEVGRVFDLVGCLSAVDDACVGTSVLTACSFSFAGNTCSKGGLRGTFPTFLIERKACAARERSVLDLLSVGTEPCAHVTSSMPSPRRTFMTSTMSSSSFSFGRFGLSGIDGRPGGFALLESEE